MIFSILKFTNLLGNNNDLKVNILLENPLSYFCV